MASGARKKPNPSGPNEVRVKELTPSGKSWKVTEVKDELEKKTVEALKKKHQKLTIAVSKLETQKAKLEFKLTKEPVEEKKLVNNSKKLSNWKKPLFF